MQVELLVNGGYSGTGPCVGKQFEAKPKGEGYMLPIWQLEQAGFVNDGSVTDALYFLKHEVRVIDG